MVKADKRLWLNMTLDCQLPMMERNKIISFDCVWHQMKV